MVARINDLAYGFEEPTFGTAVVDLAAEPPLRLYQARVDGEPVSVLGTIDDGDDCGVYLVATLKGHRGKGLARRLLHAALAEARERGLRTSTLQATKLGYPVYERLGYEAICALQMWERRKPGRPEPGPARSTRPPGPPRYLARVAPTYSEQELDAAIEALTEPGALSRGRGGGHGAPRRSCSGSWPRRSRRAAGSARPTRARSGRPRRRPPRRSG